jgi:hypothetical protein
MNGGKSELGDRTSNSHTFPKNLFFFFLDAFTYRFKFVLTTIIILIVVYIYNTIEIKGLHLTYTLILIISAIFTDYIFYVQRRVIIATNILSMFSKSKSDRLYLVFRIFVSTIVDFIKFKNFDLKWSDHIVSNDK